MRIPAWLRAVFAMPLYPVLAAAYPVVFLYAQNLQEAITPGEVLIPLTISLGVTIAVLAVFRALTGHWAFAALACLLVVILFFTYGIAWDAVGGLLAGQWVLLVGWLLLAIVGLAVIWRLRGRAQRITMPLNAVVTAGLLVNLVLIGAFFLNIRPVTAHVGSGVTATGDPLQAATRPDIYWIILEEYGSQSVLRDDFQ